MRYWVIDDKPLQRTMLQALVHRLDFDEENDNVEQFGNPTEALERAISDPPDVVVIDIVMPGIDGIEWIQRFRKSPNSRRTAIVTVTQHTGSSYEMRAIAAGANLFLRKPIVPREFVERVTELKRTLGFPHAT